MAEYKGPYGSFTVWSWLSELLGGIFYFVLIVIAAAVAVILGNLLAWQIMKLFDMNMICLRIP